MGNSCPDFCLKHLISSKKSKISKAKSSQIDPVSIAPSAQRMTIYDENLNKLLEMGNNSYYLKTASSDTLVSLKQLCSVRARSKSMRSDLNTMRTINTDLKRRVSIREMKEGGQSSGIVKEESLGQGNMLNLRDCEAFIENFIYFRKSKRFFEINSPERCYEFEEMIQDQMFTMFVKEGIQAQNMETLDQENVILKTASSIRVIIKAKCIGCKTKRLFTFSKTLISLIQVECQ